LEKSPKSKLAVLLKLSCFQLRTFNENFMLGESQGKKISTNNWLNSPTADFYGLSEAAFGFSMKSIKLSVSNISEKRMTE